MVSPQSAETIPLGLKIRQHLFGSFYIMIVVPHMRHFQHYLNPNCPGIFGLGIYHLRSCFYFPVDILNLSSPAGLHTHHRYACCGIVAKQSIQVLMATWSRTIPKFIRYQKNDVTMNCYRSNVVVTTRKSFSLHKIGARLRKPQEFFGRHTRVPWV